jgi:Xaa-Pro aminopeptidase
VLTETAPAWDVERLRRERLERLQAAMQAAGLGALYLSDPANLQYVTHVRMRSSKVFVPAEGQPLALVRPRDIGYVRMEYEHVELATRVGAAEGETSGQSELSVQGIADLMDRHGVTGERLGVDEVNGATMMAFARSNIAVTDARPVLEQAKSVKTADEVAMFRSVGQQYTAAMEGFRAAIRPGATEHAIAAAVTSAWYAAGGEDVAEVEVCSGARSASAARG